MLIIKRWAGVLITLLACVTRGKCVILTHLLEQRPIMHLELQMQAKMKDWIKERSQFIFSNQIRDRVRSRQRSSNTRKQNCLVMTDDLMLSTTQELAARHSQREDGWGCVGPWQPWLHHFLSCYGFYQWKQYAAIQTVDPFPARFSLCVCVPSIFTGILTGFSWAIWPLS